MRFGHCALFVAGVGVAASVGAQTSTDELAQLAEINEQLDTIRKHTRQIRDEVREASVNADDIWTALVAASVVLIAQLGYQIGLSR